MEEFIKIVGCCAAWVVLCFGIWAGAFWLACMSDETKNTK